MNILELPTEILGKIFNHYVHDCWKVRRVDPEQASSKFRRIAAYSSSRTHPVDLTHVCWSWRTTAISMPQLWATIYACQIESERDVKMFELWLERSAGSDGTYPLTLSINQKHSRSQMIPAQAFKEFVSLAISQHRRWRYISLALDGDFEPLFEPLYTVAPLSALHGFQVDFSQWGSDGLRRLIGTLCSSTALRSVQFGKNFHRKLTNNLMFDIVPWHRLTSVNFLLSTPSRLIRILSSSMDNLQHISINALFSPLSLDGSTPIPNVTMLRLQSLHIGLFAQGFHASEMFDKLTLPSLHELYLPGGFISNKNSELQTRGWESLLSLLRRSNCKLQAFEFGDDNTQDLIKNLKSPPLEHLTSLKVTSYLTGNFDISFQLLDPLSEACEETQRPRMLPLLETLTLEYVNSEDRVRKMVSARVAAYGGCGNSKLRRVCAQYIDVEEYALEINLSDRK
ncbi:hypothetical protein H1R20_g15130, partial [Candolleomyces eurysporus]